MMTDAEMLFDVRAQLDWEPLLGAAHIGVSVKDGVVALTEHVASCLECWVAERAAERVAGVKGVVNVIDVALPASSRRSDADIAQSAQSMLHWMTSLPLDCVGVVVDSGWITLVGSVKWDYQKQAAAAAVRHVIGAAGVTDHIGLDARGSATPTRPELDSVLNWRASIDLPARPSGSSGAHAGATDGAWPDS